MAEEIREKGREVVHSLLLIGILLAVFGIHFYLGIEGVLWAWPLAAIPLGFAIVTLAGLTPWGAWLLPYVERFLPWVRVARDEVERAARNSRVLAEIEGTLIEFGLVPLPRASGPRLVTADGPRSGDESVGTVLAPSLRKKLMRRLVQKEPTEAAIAQISRSLRKDRAGVSKRVLLLLHRSRMGKDTAALWAQRGTYVTDLAKVLLGSAPLPDREPAFPVDQDLYFPRLLTALDRFSLEAVRRQLKRLHSIWGDTVAFSAFLNRHGIPVEEPAPDRVFETLEQSPGLPLPGDHEHSPRGSHSMLIALARSAVAETFPQNPPQVLRAFAAFSVALFCNQLPGDRANLQQRTSRSLVDLDIALPLVMAYLAYQEMLQGEHKIEGRDFVSLDYLFSNWINKVMEERELLDEGFEVELKMLEKDLARGTWNDCLPPLIQKALKKLGEQMGGLKELVVARTSTLDSMKRIFRGLRLSTIERYLEAKKVKAYLLAFDRMEGKLAQLIEVLTDREKLESLGIETMVNGRPRYMLKQYTHSSRIGLVPENWTFDDFHKAFQEDFEQIVQHRKELFPEEGTYPLKGIELTLQRFGLQDFYAFDSELRSRKAIRRIKELFAEYLDIEEQLAIIGYEIRQPGTVIRSIMDGPISELIGQEVTLLPTERSFLDRNDGELKGALYSAVHGVKITEFACWLFLHRSERAAVAVPLANRMRELSLERARRPEEALPEGRCARIASAYLDTLVVIAETQGQLPIAA